MKEADHFRIIHRVIVVIIGLALLYWIVESVVGTFVMHEGSFLQQIFTPGIHELWMRALVVGIIIFLGIYRRITLTKRIQAAEALFENEERLRTIFDSTQSGIVIIDASTHVIRDLNPAAAKMIGVARDQIFGKICHRFICPNEEGECPISDLGQTLDDSERVLVKANGRTIPILKTATSTFIDGHEHIVESWMDISERKKMESELEKKAHDLGERVKELECLYGISKVIEKPGVSLQLILKGVVALMPPAWQYPEITCARVILDGRVFKSANFKKTRWKQVANMTVHGRQAGTVEVHYLQERSQRDEGPFLKEERNLIEAIAERLGRVVERMQAEERIEYLSFHDVLTGLYNRRFFQNELERLSHSRYLPIGIVMADIDGLKRVNDTLGHKTGDKLLQEVAMVLESATRKEDVLARVGGDEFAVILPGIDAKETELFSARIRKAFDEQMKKKKLDAGISIGFAIGKDRDTSLHMVLARADQDMYRAKKLKKSKAAEL